MDLELSAIPRAVASDVDIDMLANTASFWVTFRPIVRSR
jgi:hypothetical protein